MNVERVISIYRLRNTVNGKSRVGQTRVGIAKRLARYKRDADGGDDSVISRAIRKHGWSAFNKSVLEVVTHNVRVSRYLPCKRVRTRWSVHISKARTRSSPMIFILMLFFVVSVSAKDKFADFPDPLMANANCVSVLIGAMSDESIKNRYSAFMVDFMHVNANDISAQRMIDWITWFSKKVNDDRWWTRCKSTGYIRQLPDHGCRTYLSDDGVTARAQCNKFLKSIGIEMCILPSYFCFGGAG